MEPLTLLKLLLSITIILFFWIVYLAPAFRAYRHKPIESFEVIRHSKYHDCYIAMKTYVYLDRKTGKYFYKNSYETL